MHKSKAKQFARAGKKVGQRIDHLDLDKAAVGVANRAGLASRERKLGLPIGRKRPNWGRIAGLGAAALALLIGSGQLRNGRAMAHEPQPAGEGDD